MNTGEKIKRLRKERGWTQEELGNKIGVQKAAINKYEIGTVINFKRETISNLAKVFDVDPIWLFDEDHDWPPVPSIRNIPNKTANTGTQPITPEARIISGGIDKLPKEQRERALAMFRVMFEPQYADLFTKENDDNDDT